MFNENLRGVFFMPRINVIKTIESIEESCIINPNYDITVPDVNRISECYLSKSDAIMKAFALGYAQALKAQKAEAKRKAKAVQL